MAAYPGGTQVRSGYYVHGRSLEFANIPKDGGTLPGGPESRWVRIPVLAAMAAAPALGGLFVLSLPLITVGVAVYAIAKKIGLVATTGAKEIAATVTPAWTPGEAHLAGEGADRAEAEAGGAGGEATRTTAKERLDALAREIEAKRNEKS